MLNNAEEYLNTIDPLINLDNLSIENYETIQVNPNVVDGVFNIHIPFLNTKVAVEVYDLSARLLSKNDHFLIEKELEVGLRNFTTGIYIVKLLLGKPIVLKIIKK